LIDRPLEPRPPPTAHTFRVHGPTAKGSCDGGPGVCWAGDGLGQAWGGPKPKIVCIPAVASTRQKSVVQDTRAFKRSIDRARTINQRAGLEVLRRRPRPIRRVSGRARLSRDQQTGARRKHKQVRTQTKKQQAIRGHRKWLNLSSRPDPSDREPFDGEKRLRIKGLKKIERQPTRPSRAEPKDRSRM
jgi:hypothetical protein